MSILPSSSPKHRTPGAGRSFGEIVAAETLRDAEAWINEVSGTDRARRLGLVADMLLAANPETPIDVTAEAVEVDVEDAAELAVETLIVKLGQAEEKRTAATEPQVYPAAWYEKTAEGRAVAAASPFRSGPRWVTRSGRVGATATAGRAA